MICPVCVEAGRTKGNHTAGRWKAVVVPSTDYYMSAQKRMVCQTCGYMDTRDVWVDGVYHGPKYFAPPSPK